MSSISDLILACGDRLVMDFINWCKAQDFYDDTVIVISGDHPRMDKVLINDTKFADRQVYNCFINAAKAPQQSVQNRIFTSQDMFPTMLSAMGFEIEGNRLGLGTNMFSAQPTLAEELGLKYYKDELKKSSAFYIKNFS